MADGKGVLRKRRAKHDGDEDGPSMAQEEQDEEDPWSMFDLAPEEREKIGKMIQVDFEFFDPSPCDGPSLRSLMQQLMDGDCAVKHKVSKNKRKKMLRQQQQRGEKGSPSTTGDTMDMSEMSKELEEEVMRLNLDEMVEFVVRQSHVGTVVKTASGGDDDEMDDDEQFDAALGFLSVLNVQQNSDLSFVKHIVKQVIRKAPEESRERFEAVTSAASDTHLGLILSERVQSLPPALVPHLHQGVNDEMQWANEDAVEAGQPVQFQFSHFLVYTTALTLTNAKKGSSKRRRTEEEDGPAFSWVKLEDEVFSKFASEMFSYRLTEGDDPLVGIDSGFSRERVVMLIEADQMPAILEEVHSVAGQRRYNELQD